ncbi:phosphatase PAP2 family protein, partial [Leclercia adecarboxylata]|uniref:phosphatase PAP2 family protein n=1 Tax=Leclercia adecarboxylata TaxID=83655 RepID=UPI00234C9489|nr:phosphatase PAP2 family protein [Leclercia adecarboxylata]
LEALRAHALRRVELTELKGIIQFPSFHTTLALIFPYVHRDSGRLFRPLLALNLILLISIPVGGGHHFADMIAGAVIGLLAIAIARHLGSRQPGIAGPGKERLATAEDLGSS